MYVVLAIAMICGCSYFQPKDEPPPLPPIEEIKPPLTMKGEYFRQFPWDELPRPLKDGNDPDTFVYTFKEGDTLEEIAADYMGSRALADDLAAYNELSYGGTSPETSIPEGEKIVIPYPIIGMKSTIQIKHKGDKQFGDPVPFETEVKPGDEYRMLFEPNVDGHCYVFAKGVKKVIMLYPKRLKKGPRNRNEQPLMRTTSEVIAHIPVKYPPNGRGMRYDKQRAGDKIHVFLSLRKIPELEDLIDDKEIKEQDLEDVLIGINEGAIYREGPYTLMRIPDPKEILHFSKVLSG
jgi:hypothetical protein